MSRGSCHFRGASGGGEGFVSRIVPLSGRFGSRRGKGVADRATLLGGWLGWSSRGGRAALRCAGSRQEALADVGGVVGAGAGEVEVAAGRGGADAVSDAAGAIGLAIGQRGHGRGGLGIGRSRARCVWRARGEGCEEEPERRGARHAGQFSRSDDDRPGLGGLFRGVGGRRCARGGAVDDAVVTVLGAGSRASSCGVCIAERPRGWRGGGRRPSRASLPFHQ